MNISVYLHCTEFAMENVNIDREHEHFNRQGIGRTLSKNALDVNYMGNYF